MRVDPHGRTCALVSTSTATDRDTETETETATDIARNTAAPARGEEPAPRPKNKIQLEDGAHIGNCEGEGSTGSEVKSESKVGDAEHAMASESSPLNRKPQAGNGSGSGIASASGNGGYDSISPATATASAKATSTATATGRASARDPVSAGGEHAAQHEAAGIEERETSRWAALWDRYGSVELENKGSVARDHLALERTYLSYLRTSLSFASIGIAITQLFRLSPPSSSSPSSILAPHLHHIGKPLGATFLAVSILTLFLGFHRYFEAQHYVIRGKFPASRGGVVVLSVVAGGLVVGCLGVVVGVGLG